MTQLSIAENAPLDLNPDLAQWFSPDWLADHLLDSVRVPQGYGRPLRVLEPSAGNGALLRALARQGFGEYDIDVDVVEIDARFGFDLEREARVTEGVFDRLSVRGEICIRVEICDYLKRPAPSERYDIAITNPPFTRGMETPFLAKLLDECDQIVAILPSRALHGLARHGAIWRRFEPVGSADPEWSIRAINYCKRRPKFAGANGGKDEIVIVNLQRAPGWCHVRWI